jgi:TonB-linked SusC/RagA family outer membrane protein
MKKISFYKGRLAFWYLIIIGFSLSYTPTLANKILRQNQYQRQQIQVSGTITDGTSPLPGVTIAIKGKATTGTISDFNGQYSITASPDDILVFAFLGFKTATATINGRKTINIQLQEDITSLQEVRVNAGYYSVKEKERTGSIARITAATIEKQPVTNVLAAMQGRMAGVNITQTTGVAGGGFDIQIRGLNSVRTTGNAPLYIIDGVPYASESIGSFSTSRVLAGENSPLNSLNPDTIESIEVLKDADATAIYGSRGANGVILITTKKGKGGKTQFQISSSTGAGSVTRFMDLMKTEQYIAMRKEAYKNDGITTYPANAYDVNGKWDEKRYTDWQEKLTGGTAQFTNLNASVSGGSDQTQFLMSTNVLNQTTVFPGDFRYKKMNAHVSVNHTSADQKFRTTFTAAYTIQDNNQPYLDLTRESRLLSPNAPALYDADGNLNWENNTFINPLRHLNGKFNAMTYDLIANSVLSYQLLPSLEFTSAFGFSDLRHQESATIPSTINNPSLGIGTSSSNLSLNNVNRQTSIIEPQLNWNYSFGKAVLSVLVGSTLQTQKGVQTLYLGKGFASNSMIENIAAASTVTVSQNGKTEYHYQALFGRVNFNWDRTYIINFTGRHDGSSRFGPGKQYATFGAVGAAWLFSNEKWLKEQRVLSLGKLRASYGTTGSDQIGDYQFLDTYTNTGIAYEGVIGLEPTRLFNPDFGWETNNKFEIGLETGFFKDHILISASWYSNRSSNQLVGIPLPTTTGFESLQANLNATVQNRGLELTLRTENFNGKNFSWSTHLNFSSSKNKLVSFPGLEGSTYRNLFVVGQPLNIVKVFEFTGVHPETGLYTFTDFNGDGEISENDDMKVVKDLNPQFYGGLQNHFKYKQFELDFLFQFVKQENYNILRTFPMPGTRNNQPNMIIDQWQNVGDSATYQGFSVNKTASKIAYNQYSQSTASISDASYIRLKNVAVSYTLPKNSGTKVDCRLSLQGQNVLTFTNFKGADPEFKMFDYLPPLKMITAGVEITF